MRYLIIYIEIFLTAFLFFSCKQRDIWSNANRKIDDDPPDLISAASASNTLLEAIFSEEVHKESAENLQNYSISGLSVTGAARNSNDFSRVILTTCPQKDIQYELIVTGVLDEFLNEIGAQNTAQFQGDGLPEVISAYPADSTHVNVIFSEDVTVLGTFSIAKTSDPEIPLNIMSINGSGADYELVTNTQSQVNYTLIISAVQDATNDPVDIEYDFNGYDRLYLINVSAISNEHVEVQFSENVEENSAGEKSHYALSSRTDIVPIDDASRGIDQWNIVFLHTKTSLSEGKYILKVTDVLDEDQLNPVGVPDTWEFSYSE